MQKRFPSLQPRTSVLAGLLSCVTVATSLVWAHMGRAGDAAKVQTAASGDSFEFSTSAYTPYNATLLGNGYLFDASSWEGTNSSEASLAGLYDHLEQKAYTYQALIPSWSGVDYWNGSHWLNEISAESMQAGGYRQNLDTRNGILSTRYDWLDANHSTHVEVEEFVSRENLHLGVTHIQVTPDFGVEVGPLTVSFPLGSSEAPVFNWEGANLPGAIPIFKIEADPDHRGFLAISKTRDENTQVAEAVRIALPPNLPPQEAQVGLSPSLQRPALNVKFIAQRGQTYKFTKFVGVVSSQDSNSPVEEAQKTAEEAQKAGYERLLEAHEQAWQRIWRTDIVIQGDPEAQRVVHAAMYYLLSSLCKDCQWSIPAMTLPSRAYLGRIWWDADTFVFPSILVLHPELARSIVDYRCRLLPEAEQNARERDFRGAKFPMESAGTGSEEAPEWSSEIHITGDVAMAQWRFYQATGDRDWLRRCGYPVIRSVADFWASRLTRNKQGDRYEILDVTGPNEAITHIDNDAYTNAIAKRTMEVASEAAHLLGETPHPDWERIARMIFVPFDPRRQYHPEHSGDEEGNYAHALILLTYPLDMDFADGIKRNDLKACLKNFGKPGYEVGMLGNFYSVAASELGDRNTAYDLFLSTMRSYAKPPFFAMTETPGNNRAVFLTAEGAFLQQIIFGFTGLRLSSEGLTQKYKPSLPPSWQSLQLRSINVHGKAYNVSVTNENRLTMTPVAE